jgi:ABC-type sugar transport system substrate-binding protein
MRKNSVLSAGIVSALLAVVVSAGFSNAASASSTPKFTSNETSYSIGYTKPVKRAALKLAYLNPFGGNEFLDAMGNAMKKATESLGGTFISLDGKGDVNLQVSQLQQLTAQKVDGVFVFALDPNAMKPALAAAHAAGIKLISVDENFKSSNIGSYDSQLLQRRDEAAYLGAQEMSRLIGKGSKIATIDFAVAVPSIVYSIVEGKKWAKKFGLAVGANASNPSDDIAGGSTAGTTLLSGSSDVKGIIAYNDPSAIGASTAAKSLNKMSVKFGGQNGGSDAFAAVKAGTISYTIQLAAPSLGKYAAWGLYDLKQGVKVAKTTRGDAPVLVTSRNINKVKTWAQILAKM